MQKRELWKVIVFGIITLGIYDLYWMYKTRNEMVAKGQKIPSFWILFAPLLLLILVMLMQFLLRFILTGANPDAPEQSAQVVSSVVNLVSVLAGVVAILALIPVWIWWTYMYSKAVEAVTKGRTTFGFTFGMALLLNLFSVGFIWPALVQDGFNKNT